MRMVSRELYGIPGISILIVRLVKQLHLIAITASGDDFPLIATVMITVSR